MIKLFKNKSLKNYEYISMIFFRKNLYIVHTSVTFLDEIDYE